MWKKIGIALVSTYMVFGSSMTNNSDLRETSYGLLDSVAAAVLNKSIIAIAANMSHLNFPNFTIDSGQQEFGTFNIFMDNLTLIGLETVIGETIKINVPPPGPLRIENLTLYVPHLVLNAADYELSGEIRFPIGGKILPLSGSDGVLVIEFDDLRLSFDVLLAINGTGVVVDELVMLAGASAMTFHADNLMGGGKIGWTFNTVLNDVAIVAFDYYKDPIIAAYLDRFKLVIDMVICKVLPLICNKQA